ncbi:MAG TPA: hypothetical protein VI282_00470, partial [Verrucomicrobiae bacterium]
QFSPGAHQLLPSKEYFDLGFRPLIEDGFDIDTNGLPNEAFTYDRYTNALAKHFLRKPAEELGWTLASLDGAHPVAANIRKFRDTKPIGDHSQDINDVEVHHIFGMGATADTIGQIRVRARLVSETNKTNVTVSLARVASRETEQVRDGPDTLISLGDGNLAVSETNQFRMSEELEVRYVAGDGTVPIASLVRGFGSERNLNAPKAQLHPIVGGFDDDFTGHNPMLNSPEFFDIFDRIYVGRKITNIDLSITANNLSEGSLGTIDVILNGLPPAESGAEISYVVDFGDDGVELKNGGIESVTFQHRYRQSGDYMITAAASGGNESYGVTSKFVHVTNEPPQVTIVGLTDTVNLGESRIAIAKVNDPGLDDRHTFVWSVGGVVASGLNQFAVPLTFNTPGQQIVKVVVTDSDGAQVETPFTVNVRSTASSTADANFGPDPAAQAPLIAQAPPIAGFQGGHPEIIVRFHGHAPSSFGTVGLSDKQEGIGSAIGDAAAAIAFGGVFDLIGPVALDQIILPGAARFMGQLAQDSEYVRLERELPSEVASIDIAATRALVGARGNDRPVEVDVLYIEGGKPKNLYRWVVPKVAATEGLRMTFRWIPEPSVSDATLERVAADTVTSPLRASAIETIPPIFVGDGEQKAGDRSGPATLGILNPATEQIRILARDNLTVESKISLFAVFDANENGRFDDDIFYPLDTNVVSYARLPKRPFAIVGVDEQGNVGGLDPFTLEETHNFLVDKNPNEQLSEYEKKLNEVRAAVRGAITDGFSSPDIVTKYLLKPSHLWVFEQGSGANLWKADYVQRCNGIYIPGKSDNDYELILPVFLENEYQFNEQERQRFVNAGPHEEATLRGDWYFKRPAGIDVAGNQTDDIQAVFEWQFDIPAGFLFEGQNTFRVPRTADDENLAVGFHSPLTPAEIIARVFTQQITRNGSRRKALPDTTFFPERREHFMFGQLHLERPPAFGDDPIGDAGTGRQMLMLKWLMEGAYVTPDDSTTGPGSNFSQGAPTLASIYANWKQAGVPLAEGFEWGVFQDFAALKSRPFQVLSVRLSNHGTTDSPRLVRRFYDDAALEQQASRIKKLGKAAIRAALARLAGDNNLNPLVAGVSIDTVINNPARSFEDFILKQARSSDDAKAAFGAFAQDRDDVKDPPDLGDFLRAKNADRNYLQTILTTPGSYERFVTTTFQFLRTVVQTSTRPTYGAYTNTLQLGGKFSELLQRSENLNFVLQGRGSTQPGLLALNTDRRITRTPIPIGVEVYSPGAVGQINISLDHSEDDPAPAPPSGKKKQSLAQADNLQTTIDGAPDKDETVADGENAAEGSAEINPFDEPTIITEISAVTGSAIDPTQEDNTVVVDATAIDPAIPAPAVSSDPIVFVSIRPAGDESVFQLEDWPAIGNRPQSPRYLLRQTDKLEIQLLAAGGLPPFVATVTSESDPAGRIVLLEDRSDIGSYDNLSAANVIQFRHTTDPLPNRIYVKDEEILTIRINGNDVDKEIKVMVDLGEMSLATLQHHDRPLSQKPRFDYVKQFLDLDPENHDSFKFFTGGFTEFNDSIATLAGGGANDMQKFIQHFADPTPLFASMGEADILYVHAHGAGDGRLGEHISNSDTNGTRQTILRPSADLTTPGFWRSDAEWAILDACLTLNTIVSGGAAQPGRINWEGVLANVNGGPERRFPHGILGFERTKPAARSPHLAFMGLLQRGFRFVDAWQISMDSFNQPWAALYYRSAVADTVREISQDPGVGDAIDYQESTGFFSDFDCEECDSESPTFRPFDEIGTLPLEHAPENWAQAENALRSCGYDPNDFWQLGVSEESSIQISGAIASERRIVAQSYHLQKALGEDDARVVVRI